MFASVPSAKVNSAAGEERDEVRLGQTRSDGIEKSLGSTVPSHPHAHVHSITQRIRCVSMNATKATPATRDTATVPGICIM